MNKFGMLLTFLLIQVSALAQIEISPVASNGVINLSSGTQTLYFTNKGSASQSLNLSISQVGSSISLNRCSVLAAKKTCYIVVSVFDSLMPVGVSSFPLLNGSNSLVSLQYTKNAPVEFSEFSSSSLITNDFEQKTITIRNKTLSQKSYAPTISGVDSSKFEIVLNRCSNINPNASCSITLRLKPQAEGNYLANLNEPQIAGSVTLSGSVSSSTQGVIVEKTKILSVSNSVLDFGTINRLGVSGAKNIVVTNIGTGIISPIVSVSDKMRVVFNRCLGVLLTPNNSCSVALAVVTDSLMPNGPILSQSVLVQTDSSDISPVSVNISASLNVLSSCLASQHFEGGTCVSNTRSCLVNNGQGSQSWSSGSWGSCAVVSCNSDYHQVSNNCEADEYVAIFSDYSPSIPTALNPCDESVLSTRLIMECNLAHNGSPASSLTKCSDPAPSVNTLSPAGNKVLSISNGSETYSCLMGSTSQTLVSRNCDSGFYNDGTSCQAVQYVPTYSLYNPEIPILNACDGTVVSNRTIEECRQQHDNQLVSNSFCNDPTPTVTTQSPAGDKTVSIANGSEVKSCTLGSSAETFVSRNCDSGFYSTSLSEVGSCSPVSYVAQFSDYSPPVPTQPLNVCDGTVTSTRTISECKEVETNNIVSSSFCTDPTPVVTTLSPSGNAVFSISNGSESVFCTEGSSFRNVLSRTCDLGYNNNDETSCQLNQNYWGNASLGNLNSAGNVNLCDSTVDGEMCVAQYNNLTINAGHTLTTAVRRRGLMIYVQGDLVLDGTISMKARGAFGDPVSFGVGSSGLKIIKSKSGGTSSGTSVLTGAGATAVSAEANQGHVLNGVAVTIPRTGAAGTTKNFDFNMAINGNDGVGGRSGGGGSGWLYRNGGNNNAGGAGAAGTCFSGGAGGGGSFVNTGSNYQCQDGGAFGGKGGNGCGDHPFATGGGGAGNPAGTYTPGQRTYSLAEAGTGGLLIILVKGNIIVGTNGKITTEGSAGGATEAFPGGGSGGGPLVILHGGLLTNNGTITTSGGLTALSPLTRGGNGSSLIFNVDP